MSPRRGTLRLLHIGMHNHYATFRLPPCGTAHSPVSIDFLENIRMTANLLPIFAKCTFTNFEQFFANVSPKGDFAPAAHRYANHYVTFSLTAFRDVQ